MHTQKSVFQCSLSPFVPFPRGGQQFIQQCCETLASYLVLVSKEMPVGKHTKRDRETELKREGERKASPPRRRALGKRSELDAEQRLFPFRHRQGEPRVCEMNNN